MNSPFDANQLIGSSSSGKTDDRDFPVKTKLEDTNSEDGDASDINDVMSDNSMDASYSTAGSNSSNLQIGEVAASVS